MAAKSLKHLARKPIHPAQLARQINALFQMPDQAAALVSGALLERTLERAILSRMTPLTKTQRNELFVGLAPLASFAAKVKIAYALGIIGTKGLTDLDRIKDIRNQFAHAFHPITFATEEVRLACQNLKATDSSMVQQERFPPEMLKHPKVRFILACLGIYLALFLVNGPRPPKRRTAFSRAFLH